MKSSLHGSVDRPVIAVIGVWDPLLPAHERLFEALRASARKQSLATLAIAIDPDPVRFLWGPSSRPVYSDASTRIQQILHRGLDAVLRVGFVRRDLDATAAELFRVVDPHARIAELWLGARQSLGRCQGGNAEAILAAANSRGIQVIRLPKERLESSRVRDLLQSGQLVEAAGIVGRPPILSRPASGKLRLCWCPGSYKALATADPNVAPRGRPLTLLLSKEGRKQPSLDWPDARTPYLAFVSGPGDRRRERIDDGRP